MIVLRTQGFWDVMLYHWVDVFWHFKGMQHPYLLGPLSLEDEVLILGLLVFKSEDILTLQDV